MSRYLFAVWPFVGHINPFLSVALALKRRGHEVAFYTGSDRKALLEEQGVEFFPFQRVQAARIFDTIDAAEIAAPRGKMSPALARAAFREWLANSMEDQIADLQPIIRDWRAEALIAETGMWGPLLVLSETASIPVAILSTLLGSLVPTPSHPLPGLGLPPPSHAWDRAKLRVLSGLLDVVASGLRRHVNRVRAAHGLAPIPVSVNHQTGQLPLYLVPSIPELDYGRSDLPDHVKYVGPCLWNRPETRSSTAWLDTIPSGVPWVHVTEGTAHHHEPFVLRSAMRGLANLPMEVILTTGEQRDPESLDLGPPASNLHLVRWVNHLDLLPRCRALVTTGGAGTIMTALRFGVPLVIVPTHWDKPDNAARVVAAGVGIRLPAPRCDPATLREAVEHVLSHEHYQENARKMSDRLSRHQGPETAAAFLEDLLRRRQAQATTTQGVSVS